RRNRRETPRISARNGRSGSGRYPSWQPHSPVWFVSGFHKSALPLRSRHCIAHGAFHLCVVIRLAIDNAADLVFALGDDDVDGQLALLPEAPAAAHRLIPKLVAVRAADECHPRAMGPVKAEAEHRGLADEMLDLTRRKRLDPLFLHLGWHGAANFNGM